jgi:hypothetical protein
VRRRFALGALVAAVALVVGAGTALAAFPPTVSVSTPVDGTVWKNTLPSDLHVIGTANTNNGDVITRVTVQVDPTDGGNKPYGPYFQSFPGDSSEENFDITVFPDLNGTYRIRTYARGRHCFITCEEADGPGVDREVVVAWPPVTPTNVKATLKDAIATVEWKANDISNEPDLLGYIVERAVGSGAFTCLKTIAFNDDNPTTYKTTDDLASKPDGDYKYRVKAVRKANAGTLMPTCAKPGGIASPPSAPASVTWDNPTPPPTTVTTAQGGGGGPGPGGGGGTGGGGGGGGTTTTTRRRATAGSSGGRTNRPNLSALGSLGVPTNLARPPGAAPEVDGGFNQLLPFGSGEEPPEGNVALPQGASEDSGDDDNGTTTLLFVAAGMLATVLSAHVLWLKAQVDKMPLEALVPEEVPLSGPLGG